MSVLLGLHHRHDTNKKIKKNKKKSPSLDLVKFSTGTIVYQNTQGMRYVRINSGTVFPWTVAACGVSYRSALPADSTDSDVRKPCLMGCGRFAAPVFLNGVRDASRG